jgi:hypothetical protein
MKYQAGQQLSFKKDIPLNVWVDCIMPAGQMGYKETHLKIKLNEYSMDMPISSISKLFTTEIIKQEKTITEKKADEKKAADKNINFEIENLSKKIKEIEKKKVTPVKRSRKKKDA